MRAVKSAQAKLLRRKLFARMALILAAFTAVFLVACVYLYQYAFPAIGNAIADATANEFAITQDELDAMYSSATVSSLDSWQVYAVGDGTYAARDLGVYYAAKELKTPLVVGVYLVVCIGILFSTINRSIRYFDELSAAVAGQFSDRGKPVELPDDLRIVRSELEEIRLRSLADEVVAKMAEQRKNELVAYLAHDTRTPLTSVLGYLSLLRDTPSLPEAQRVEFAGIAYEKAERLGGLIDEFFEITRYNLQSVSIERETVDIAFFCRQVADEFFPEAEARGVKLSVEATKGETFFVDPDKFARALSNVVRNAIAFAERGSTIPITATVEGGRAVIEVENRGREISPAHLQSIFEKFYREDAARSTNRGGAGLGLAIAKEIVAAHGGDIAARSDRGVTVFTLAVPAARESAQS